MHSRTAPELDRPDRYVRRSYLKIPPSVSRHRLTYALEEALRLAVLPGEEEGRLYCFRRVDVSGIPAEANHKTWVNHVHGALTLLAAQAVHATDPRAAHASAVYFHNREEALETLLRNAIHSEKMRPWFFDSVLGTSPDNAPAIQIQTVLEKLREPAISKGAAAAIIFAAIGSSNPAPLLAALSSLQVREWLCGLETPASPLVEAPPIEFPGPTRRRLQEAGANFGWRDPRTIWLAAMAVILVSPASVASGTTVRRARSALRLLETAQPQHELPSRRLLLPHQTQPITFSDDGEFEPASSPSESLRVSTTDDTSADTTNKIHADELPKPSSLPPDSILLGEPTSAAGLYFLLNVLRRLGIVATLECCPVLTGSNFVTPILKRLAAYASIARDDPILRCLHPEQSEFALPPAFLATLYLHPEVWRSNFSPPNRSAFNSDYLLHVWVLAVRRWCWRNARMTVPEIIRRGGLVWLTHSDLDITMPLNQIDIRIRRLGLDIDPGWLPWFGEFGKSVRFHYRAREPGEPGC
jgi:hypothetical protein